MRKIQKQIKGAKNIFATENERKRDREMEGVACSARAMVGFTFLPRDGGLHFRCACSVSRFEVLATITAAFG